MDDNINILRRDVEAVVAQAKELSTDDANLEQAIRDIADSQIFARERVLDVRNALSALATRVPDVPGLNVVLDSIDSYEANMLAALVSRDVRAREERDRIRLQLHELEPLTSFFKKNVQKRTCPVCFDAEVEVVMVPCGHTLCGSCAAKVDRTCFMCKQPIDAHHRIYYSV